MIANDEFTKYRFNTGKRTLSEHKLIALKQMIERLVGYEEIATEDITNAICQAYENLSQTFIKNEDLAYECERLDFEREILESTKSTADIYGSFDKQKTDRIAGINDIRMSITAIERKYAYQNHPYHGAYYLPKDTTHENDHSNKEPAFSAD